MHRLPIPCIRTGIVIAALVLAMPGIAPTSRAAVTREDVERAIRDGIRYLKGEQKADGSWEEFNPQARTGTTSLVTLALLTAGERADSPTIRKALEHLRHFGPDQLRSTYAIALQTMVFAAAEPERDQLRIVANVTWLESAQIKPGERGPPGCWTYTEVAQGGDNSNTQYALLGLNAAAEVGVPVSGEVWALARNYWEKAQTRNGGWGYHADDPMATSSMTCAGISSLIITGSKRFQGLEYLQGTTIHNCGQGGFNPNLQRGIDWLAQQLQRGPELPHGPAVEALLPLRSGAGRPARRHPLLRPARLVPPRRRGAGPRPRTGSAGSGGASPRTRSSRRASRCLFLAKGRAPVLVNKLRHGPRGDWNNDPDDVRNLVSVVSRDWKTLLTWQVVDPAAASVADLLQAPDPLLQRPQGPRVRRRGAAEPPRLRRAGRLPLRRRLLRLPASSTTASSGS